MSVLVDIENLVKTSLLTVVPGVTLAVTLEEQVLSFGAPHSCWETKG